MRIQVREVFRAALATFITIAVIILAVFIGTIVRRPAAYLPVADRASVPQYVPVEHPHIPAFGEVVINSYILRDYNGRLAVFSSQNPDAPIYKTHVRIRSLRKHDQELLAVGITAMNQVHLQELLDDFTT